jgi:hypothetical protein
MMSLERLYYKSFAGLKESMFGVDALPNTACSRGQMMSEYAAYLGIDWADAKHDLCLLDAGSGEKTHLVIKHTPEAIAEYVTSLRTRLTNWLACRVLPR